MGAFLDAPITEKNTEVGSNEMCTWGAVSMQGWRCGMEDAHIAKTIDLPGNKKGTLFCVFDGHGGKEVAQFAQDHFTKTLMNQVEFKQEKYSDALTKGFMALDEKVSKQEYCKDTGTTSCVVLITDTKIYCANAGDSRGVLSNSSQAQPLSFDHKPLNQKESKRIYKATHYVEDNRVDGNLALSRAFGDFMYKDQKSLSAEEQAVTAHPDVTVRDRNDKDQFIMLACDGIWDCLSNDQCIAKMHGYLAEKPASLDEPVKKMLDDILAPNTNQAEGTDNMTAILIQFNKK